jgi:serine/threonine protein kinase
MDEESIFLKAVALEHAQKRVVFLDDACGNDGELRKSVEALLRHHEQAGDFLEVPPAELLQTVASCDETVGAVRTDRILDFLDPCDKPGYIGQLGPYQVIEPIGSGGMGVVLRAHDPKLKRDVAIKVLAFESALSPVAVKRFLREAQAAAAVRHDHIVSIHAVHDDGPLPYIIMEFVEGISLQQKIDREGPLEPKEILRIGKQIARGLDAAHKRGLVHRDIKPANILLEAETQRVKITDFGLARSLEDHDLSQEGQIVGTPQYMSPEQALGDRTDHRSDLFSLGGVLYAICTGHPPLAMESALAALRGICDDTPRPIRQSNKMIPEKMAHLVNHLLDKNPDKRPQSAKEVEERLDQQLSGPNKLNRPMIALGSALAIVLVGVIIFIVHRGGLSTKIEVPDGSRVEVTRDGNVRVQLPGQRSDAAARGPTVRGSGSGWPPPLTGFENASPTQILTSAELEWAVPVDIGVRDINWGLHLSADALTLLYAAILPGGQGDIDLWMHRRESVNDPWFGPINLGAAVNSPAIDSAPCLSSDGLTLIFESHRKGGNEAADLWMSRREALDKPWSEPVNLGGAINTFSWQRGPCLSADGLTLYYSTSAPGGNRLFQATRRLATERWSAPKPVEFSGADKRSHQTPAVSSDGLTLFFSATDANKIPQLRYCTRKSPTSPWTAPKELSPRLTMPGGILFPTLSADGQTLMFTSGGRVFMTHRVRRKAEFRDPLN